MSIDEKWAEGRYVAEPVDPTLTPERAFDRRWALIVMETAVLRLQEEFKSKDKEKEFTILYPHLAWNSGEESYAVVAEALGTTEGNIKVKVHRTRQRLREILEDEAERSLNCSMGPRMIEELRQILGAG